MYSPLNEYMMLQDMHERTARIKAARGKDPTGWPNRRWWHKAAHRAE